MVAKLWPSQTKSNQTKTNNKKNQRNILFVVLFVLVPGQLLQ